MSNLLNLIPPIRRYRLHKIRVMLDPVYESKSEDLDEFRGKLFKWSLESFAKGGFLFSTLWIALLLLILKGNILLVLIMPAIQIVSALVVSTTMYLSFRKELNLDD